MKTLRILSLLLSLTVALTVGLQNCKKAEPDPVKPGTSTNPGSSTTTPGSSTTATTTTNPSLTALTVTGVGSTSARVSAVINGNGGEEITYHGFTYYVSTLSGAPEIKLGSTSGPFPLTFTATLTNLLPNTTYTVVGRADNKKGSAQAEAKFTTAAAVVSNVVVANLRTELVGQLTAYSIEINSSVTSFKPGMNVTEVGYCYSESKPEPTTADIKAVDKEAKPSGELISFKGYLPGLKAATRYYVRPYAIVDAQTYYGSALPISTEARLSNATITPKAEFTEYVQTRPISFGINGKFYVNAQRRTSSGSSPDLFYEYSPATNAWTQKGDVTITNNSFKGGSQGLSFVANGKGYFGLSTSFTAKQELWEYDPTTDKWTRTASGLANPLINPFFIIQSTVQMGNKVYVIGTESAGATLPVRLYEFDITTRTFAAKAAPPGTNSSFNDLVALNNTLYYYSTLDQRLAEYNTSTNTWTAKKDFPKVWKNGYGVREMASLNGKLYALGHEIMEYNPAEDSWKLLLKVSTPDIIEGPCVFTLPDRLIIGYQGSAAKGAKWTEFKP